MTDQNASVPADLQLIIAQTIAPSAWREPDSRSRGHNRTHALKVAHAVIIAMQAYMASDGVVQADNDMTVKLTEWLVMNDLLDDEGDVHSLRVMDNFGKFSDDVFASHRRTAAATTLPNIEWPAPLPVSFSEMAQYFQERGTLEAVGIVDPRDALIAELREALKPFMDLTAQTAAWGVISKKLDGLSPLTVTVTKDQMIAGMTALAKSEGKA